MIPKSKAPHLSRVHRRHPERLQRALLQAPKAMPWLLHGLMMRGGYMADVGVMDMATGRVINAAPQVIAPPVAPRGIGKSILAKAGRFFRRMVGG